MAWVLTTALTALRRDLNTAFPNRDKSSDGTIGDTAHQASTSGHNPDDTAGSRSEYTDADSKAEVRALDVDADLRTPGYTMQAVVDQILRSPNDVKRLKYIIFNRRIWSRNTSWQPRAYTGPSPHTEHAHFSGDPAFDEDASPWSVLALPTRGAAAMAGPGYTAPNPNAGENVEEMLRAVLTLQPTYGTTPALTGAAKGMTGAPFATPHNLHVKLAEILTAAQAAAAGGQVTPTPEQWAALTADLRELLETLFAEKVGAAAELAAEAAIRKVLGGLDGAVPPAST